MVEAVDVPSVVAAAAADTTTPDRPAMKNLGDIVSTSAALPTESAKTKFAAPSKRSAT